MISPYVSVPYDVIGKHLDFIRTHNFNLEIFFGAGNLDAMDRTKVDELRRALSYNPSITIHAPYMDLSPGAVDPKVREITQERFSRVFDLADELGPRTIVFHSGYEKWKYAHKVDVWLEGSLRMWGGLVKRAERADTLIAIENVFEDEPRNLELLMRELGSDRVGICFDTGHFNLFAYEPLLLWLDLLGPYLIELHLHDNDRGYDSHLAIGDGSFDFEGLFKILKGRELIYTVEAHNPDDVVKSLERLSGLLYRLGI